MEKFKVQRILAFKKITILEFQKIIICKIFHSSAKLIAKDSYIDEELIFMHESIM